MRRKLIKALRSFTSGKWGLDSWRIWLTRHAADLEKETNGEVVKEAERILANLKKANEDEARHQAQQALLVLIPTMQLRAASAEERLVGFISQQWGRLLRDLCHLSSVPESFLASLIALESAGDPHALRFEPQVLRRLTQVRDGQRKNYGKITTGQLKGCSSEQLRDFATSWGLTQIMGYHTLGRGILPKDLLVPDVNLYTSLRLLAEFAERFGIDPVREASDLFRCWNTGSPVGKTYHPLYVEKGLLYQQLYEGIHAA